MIIIYLLEVCDRFTPLSTIFPELNLKMIFFWKVWGTDACVDMIIKVKSWEVLKSTNRVQLEKPK